MVPRVKMSLTTKINNKVEKINNQYFYDEPVNTYIISLPDKALLFDLPTYSLDLETYFHSLNKPIVALLSHGSCGIEDGTIWQQKIGLTVYLHKADKESPWLKMQPDILFDKKPPLGQSIAVIPTPGHSPGSICLFEETTKSLFTGDTVEGKPDGSIWDFSKDASNGDIDLRLNSCKKLLSLDFANILPFHYSIIQKGAKEALINYLEEF